METYELVLFDFDGTIADSLHQGLANYNSLASRYGFLPVTDITAARAMKTKAFFKAHKIPLRRLPRLYHEFTRLQKDHMPSVRLYDGMAEVLGDLAQRYRIGILSSNSEENIRRCLSANEVEHHFSFVVSHSSIFGKHKSMRKILKVERLPREKVVYVGDELRDMKAAAKAKIDGCAVTWGIHAENVLMQEGPRFIARQPSDLLRVFGLEVFRPSPVLTSSASVL